MLSRQPTPDVLSTAITESARGSEATLMRAVDLLKTIDGSSPNLLPILVDAIKTSPLSDIVTFSALAVREYGDGAQAFINELEAVFTSPSTQSPLALSAVLYAISNIHCTKSVDIFKGILERGQREHFLGVANFFPSLGNLARPLLGLLRQYENDEVFGTTISCNIQRFFQDNPNITLEDLLTGRQTFLEVPLFHGQDDYSPDLHHHLNIDFSRTGLLYDDRFHFSIYGNPGICRLRIGRSHDGQVAVMFTYDGKSSGASIQNNIEHLASTITRLVADLPERIDWYEHWCPSAGFHRQVKVSKMTFQFDVERDCYRDPRWNFVTNLDGFATRWGFNLDEFEDE